MQNENEYLSGLAQQIPAASPANAVGKNQPQDRLVAPLTRGTDSQRTALYMAAIDCGHAIDAETVTLYRDPKLEGNALSQLGDRLAAAAEVLVAEPASQQDAGGVALREALSRARAFIDQNASEQGYGFFRPANPHDFCPDGESCGEEEIAAHKAACEAYDKGEYVPEGGCQHGSGGHILVAPWGIGSYTYRDHESEQLIATIDAALAAPVSPTPSITTGEKA